ncbi:hypothetical protein B0H17DRAFT_511532 [Mycena rosella]|uniref:Uncharacterized protein n=1 Tax=Mycena rosella TaxID=1033263 RepID=A0AAD7FN43_MYCRO|nr:hypothetical protein B0H17DRAFT_511532 [Mycena rosella]
MRRAPAQRCSPQVSRTATRAHTHTPALRRGLETASRWLRSPTCGAEEGWIVWMEEKAERIGRVGRGYWKGRRLSSSVTPRTRPHAPVSITSAVLSTSCGRPRMGRDPDAEMPPILLRLLIATRPSGPASSPFALFQHGRGGDREVLASYVAASVKNTGLRTARAAMVESEWTRRWDGGMVHQSRHPREAYVARGVDSIAHPILIGTTLPRRKTGAPPRIWQTRTHGFVLNHTAHPFQSRAPVWVWPREA